MATWLDPATIKAPQQSDYPVIADFILAYTVQQDVVNFGSKFLAATPDARYASPQAYIAAVVSDAVNIPKFSSAFAPSTWNAVLSGVQAAMKGISELAQIAVNAGDPNTVSVLTAWENGTGQLYGGHAPIPAVPAGDGVNADTGQSAAPPGSAL